MLFVFFLKITVDNKTEALSCKYSKNEAKTLSSCLKISNSAYQHL